MANFTCPTSQGPTSQPNSPSSPSPSLSAKGLSFVRQWLNRVEIRNAAIAHLICRITPTQCPFERTITLFGFTVHIPPLCKLNPLYDEVVSLRFRALCYLADDCSEDVGIYC